MSSKCADFFTTPRTLDWMMSDSLAIVYELPEEYDQDANYPVPRLRPNRYSTTLRLEEIQQHH